MGIWNKKTLENINRYGKKGVVDCIDSSEIFKGTSKIFKRKIFYIKSNNELISKRFVKKKI